MPCRKQRSKAQDHDGGEASRTRYATIALPNNIAHCDVFATLSLLEQKKNTGQHDMRGAYDPRAIANLLLEQADREDISVTHIALQKLVYFAHGTRLMQGHPPLVSGNFEAWTHGPVHPAIYSAFKAAGSAPIRNRAVGKDALTGRELPLPLPEDPDVRRLIRQVLFAYGQMSPWLLVEISHAPGGPWDAVRDKTRTDVALGNRIPDNIILERFKHHKVSVGAQQRAGDLHEDSPLT
ncbi:type VI toxin-antitoxin system SocA family antitoxin [Pseudooceanicola sp.]|uniref:type VI toxin-antitoxin system SocA family antitoxin n=1 Tax=Pseudooceanicola sp. TaxID=1914328 RepID=UPI0040588B6E